MPKAFISIGAIALIVPAVAIAVETTGKVSRYDAEARMLALDTGFSCIVGERVAADGLRQGMSVALTYEIADGRNACTQISVAR